MKSIRIKLYFLILLLSQCILALEGYGVITEHAFMGRLISAIEDGWGFETDRIDVEIKKIELKHSRIRHNGFRLNFTSSADFDYRDKNRITNSNYIYTKKADTLDRDLSLKASKRFLNNPSKLILSYDKGLPKNSYQRFKQSEYYDSYKTRSNQSHLSIEWMVPLLKHSNGPNDLRTYRRDQLDLEDTILSFLENKEDFIVEQLGKFYDLFKHQEQGKVYETHIRELQKLLKTDPNKRIAIDRVLIELEKDLAQARRSEERIRQDLSIRLNIPELQNELVSMNFVISSDLTQNLAFQLSEQNRSLKRIQIDQDLKHIDITYHKNQDLPELNLRFIASHNIDHSTTLSSNYSDSENEFNFLIEFDMPILGYRTNRKSLEISKLQLAKHEYNYQRKKNDLIAEINALQKSLKNSESILLSYKNLIIASAQNRQQTFKNYANKLSSIEDLLDAHSDELSVQLDSIEANTNYQKELLELKNLLDVLLISEI